MHQQTTYKSAYLRLFHEELPTGVTWETSQADILSQGRGFMGDFDFTVQLQVGCPGGCLFCYVREQAMLVPKEVRGPNWGFRVRNKQDAVEKLQRYLERGTLADKTLYWSGVTDPYAVAPTVTERLWTTLLHTSADLRPRRIAIQSRFRPDRDGALIQQYAEETIPSDGGPAVVISYSIGTDRNDLIAAWERATPRFEQRMRAIQSLRNAGIFVVATLSPLGLWRDLAGTLVQFKQWGVSYLTCLFLKENTASANTPPYFLAYIREQYPVLLDPAWQADQIRTMQAVYGAECVLPGKQGFDSLAHPHLVRRCKSTLGISRKRRYALS
jgi:DNA repair photolyase